MRVSRPKTSFEQRRAAPRFWGFRGSMLVGAGCSVPAGWLVGWCWVNFGNGDRDGDKNADRGIGQGSDDVRRAIVAGVVSAVRQCRAPCGVPDSTARCRIGECGV